MRNIGLVGRRRTGKDTIAAHLVNQHGYVRVAFADALKDAALALDPIVTTAGDVFAPHYRDPASPLRLAEVVRVFGWEYAKDRFPEVRRILQHMGESIRSVIGDHAWRNVALSRIAEAEAAGRPVVVSDVRYPDEADALRDRGFLLVRLVRRQDERSEADSHASEQLPDAIDVDWTVNNGGTVPDLLRYADALITVRVH
jgi:hypothetical protein